jgi:hypothetical protein
MTISFLKRCLPKQEHNLRLIALAPACYRGHYTILSVVPHGMQDKREVTLMEP